MIARRALFCLLVVPACLLHLLAVMTEFAWAWRANNATVDWMHELWWRRPNGSRA